MTLSCIQAKPRGDAAEIDYPEIEMIVNWSFEDGRLTARDGAGKVLRWWIAEERIGRGLVVFFNHAQSLGRLLVAG